MAGHADDDDLAAGAGDAQRLGERVGRADAVDDDVGAAGRAAADHERPGGGADGPAQLVRLGHPVGAELGGQLLLGRVLGGGHDRGGDRRGPAARRSSAARACPAPMTATVPTGGTERPGRVHRAGGGLDHHRLLVGHGLRARARSCDSWAISCVDHPPPVSVQKPVCRPGSRWPKAMRSQRLIAPAAHARAGGIDAAGRAREDGHEDGPAVVVQVADDLVARA